MNASRISGFLLPVLSLFFIIQIFSPGWGLDVLPLSGLFGDNLDTDAEQYEQLAELSIDSGELSLASDYILESVRASPLAADSFIELSRIYVERGEPEKASLVLRHALQLAPRDYRNLWQIAVNALRAGDTGLAVESLSSVSRVHPYRAFETAWKVIEDRGIIFDRLVDDSNITEYLNFLRRKQAVGESVIVWNTIREKGIDVSDNLYFAYLDFLVQKGKADFARSIWVERYGHDNGAYVWNGGFEKKPVGRGFDWIITESDSVTIGYDGNERTEGEYSLRITFNGSENIDFSNVSKLIPVDPDTSYSISFDMKTRDITTDRGVFWSVDCYPGGGLSLRLPSTEGYTGSEDWFTLEREFVTPGNCTALRLVLRRLRSEQLDTHIEGTVWIDGVNIKKVDRVSY